MAEHEGRRAHFVAEFASSGWDVEEFALREADDHLAGVQLLDGRLSASRSDYLTVARRYLDELERTVSQFEPRTLLEIGSGTGRNLLWLLHRNVARSGTGLELTPSGVEVANQAAARYGLKAEFRTFDLTTSDWADVPPADVVFSVHALEQLPDPSEVLDHMERLAARAVVMIEPFPDYWRGVWGIANRLRNHPNDRLRSGALIARGVVRADLLPFGTALNRASTVVLQGGPMSGPLACRP